MAREDIFKPDEDDANRETLPSGDELDVWLDAKGASDELVPHANTAGALTGAGGSAPVGKQPTPPGGGDGGGAGGDAGSSPQGSAAAGGSLTVLDRPVEDSSYAPGASDAPQQVLLGQESIDLASLEARNLYDFGPFADFAEKLGIAIPALDSHSVGANIFANNYLSKAREALNDAFLVTPGAAEPGMSGLSERKTVLGIFSKKMEVYHVGLTSQLDEQQAKHLEKYQQTIGSLVRSEHAKIQLVASQMQQPGTLSSLLANTARSVFGSKPGEASTKLHQARERDITDRLNRLHGIAEEMKLNVGNAAWENTIGLKKAAEANEHFEHTSTLIGRVVGQTDEKGFLNRFGAIKKNFAVVNDKSVTDEFRNSMIGMLGRMNQFFNRVFEKLGFRSAAPAAEKSFKP